MLTAFHRKLKTRPACEIARESQSMLTARPSSPDRPMLEARDEHASRSPGEMLLVCSRSRPLLLCRGLMRSASGLSCAAETLSLTVLEVIQGSRSAHCAAVFVLPRLSSQLFLPNHRTTWVVNPKVVLFMEEESFKVFEFFPHDSLQVRDLHFIESQEKCARSRPCLQTGIF